MVDEVALAGIAPIDPARIGSPDAGSAVSGAARIGETSFAEALQGVAQNAVQDIRQAEQISLQALAGEADVRDVTDAVMSAEQSLNAAVAIRDKIVTAFLEISRMQI